MILLDLDGVCADFGRGACILHGRPNYAVTRWDWYKDWGLDDLAFWSKIEQAGDRFYPDYVPPYDWLRDLLRDIRHHGDFTIATAAPAHPGLLAGKIRWIEEYIGKCPVVFFLPGRNGSACAASLKALAANNNNILVDDSDRNIDAFRGMGGRTITFPQPWNRLHNVRNRVQYVSDVLLGYSVAA